MRQFPCKRATQTNQPINKPDIQPINIVKGEKKNLEKGLQIFFWGWKYFYLQRVDHKLKKKIITNSFLSAKRVLNVYEPINDNPVPFLPDHFPEMMKIGQLVCIGWNYMKYKFTHFKQKILVDFLHRFFFYPFGDRI